MAYIPSHLPMTYCATRETVRLRAGRTDGATEVENASVVFCMTGSEDRPTIYVWNYASSAADDDNLVLQPTAYVLGENGRWIIDGSTF